MLLRLNFPSFQGMTQSGKGAIELLLGLREFRKGMNGLAPSKVASPPGVVASLIGGVKFGTEWMSYSSESRRSGEEEPSPWKGW